MKSASNWQLVVWGLCLGIGASWPGASAQVVVGPGAGPTTVQLPTFGVAVDAEGVLAARQFGFMPRMPAPAGAGAEGELHVVSLDRLQQAIKQCLTGGDSLPEVILHLAGLTRIEYVVIDRQDHDILLAGPSEPWLHDPAGRVLGAHTLRPVLLLEDLWTAFRTFPPGGQPSWVGCSISPSQGAVRRLARVDRALPRTIAQGSESRVTSQWLREARNALGRAEVVVFGISPATHLAHVLVEADYRMKLIACGLEPPPVPMPTFFGELTGSPSDLQRWWFTPDERSVRIDEDHLTMQLVGQGVRLGTEEYVIHSDGSLQRTAGRPSRAARRFAESFTREYATIARVSPVYAQLRAAVDVLVVAAFLQKYDAWPAAEVTASPWWDDTLFSVTPHAVPKTAECVVNAGWRGRRLIAVAGGGVSIQADLAFAPKSILNGPPDDTEGLRTAIREQRPTERHRWHWSLGNRFQRPAGRQRDPY